MKAPFEAARRVHRGMLQLLRGRDPLERQTIGRDADRLIDSARRSGPRHAAATWLALIWDLVTAGIRHDLVRAARSLVRAPGFAVTASLLLGLGVAATTTLFALVNAVMLEPLPYDAPERLVKVWESNVAKGRLREGPSPGNLNDWVAHSDAFESLTGWWIASATLRGPDESVPVRGVQVTRGFFEVFRRAPMLGRTFSGREYDGRPSIASGRAGGEEPVLVLSHRLWRGLGGDPTMVGRTVHVEGRDWRVLGVMPPDFAVPDAAAAFWTPWDMHEGYRGPKFPDGPPRDFRFLSVAGRVKPGLSHEAAAGNLAVLAARAAADHPQTNANWTVELEPLRDALASATRAELLLVFAAVSCLLLLVCANVASLAIARAAVRAREMAIRQALGAGRRHLVRQHLAETLVCAGLILVVSAAFTAWSLDAVVAFAPQDIPRLHEVGVNARVIVFAATLSLVVTFIGIMMPGLRGSARVIASTLKDGQPASGRRASRMRRALVVAEIGVTVVLLAGAGLLARSFAGLQRVDPGFDVRNLLVLRIAPDVTKYRGSNVVDYYARVVQSLRALPGVAAAGAVTFLPMSTIGQDFYRPYWLNGERPAGNAVAQANVRMATPGYFHALGLPLVSGREFTAQDGRDAPRVVVVNESLARSAWNGGDPIGQTLMLDYQGGPSVRHVIGVVRDARYHGPRSEPEPEIFIPHAQNPYLVMNVVVRTKVDPASLARTARVEALKADPDQPIHSVTTMEALLDDSLQQDRFAMLFVALFAAAGLVTAASGVYALLAYTVGQQRREIAVRMAIGASSAAVARSVVAESLTLALAGCLVGAAGVAAFGGIVGSVLFGIAPQDPLTLVATAAILLVAVTAASGLPAWRAAKTNPVAAMRT